VREPLDNLTAVRAGRSIRHQALVDAIAGALVYLRDAQIQAPTEHCLHHPDTLECAGGCRIPLDPLPGWPALYRSRLWNSRVLGICGEWPNFIHFFPNHRRSLFLPIFVQDSNPFVTASIVHALLLIDDGGAGAVEPMLARAMRSMTIYKRGAAYGFWPPLPPGRSDYPVVGPPNLPIRLVDKVAGALISRSRNSWLAKLRSFLGSTVMDWVRLCSTSHENLPGAYTFFNVPNDADDTSVIVAAQTLYARVRREAPPSDAAALRHVILHRDVNRAKEDNRNTWKRGESGAYLTWLRDEDAPLYGDPADGVVPLGVNNVDAVTNANCLFALAVNDMKDAPGYTDCETLLARVVRERHWPAAGIYYPQRMMFPYCASRAYRDGGARSPVMTAAMGTLLLDLLEMQEPGELRGERVASFPDANDESRDLSTALGCATLLNVGRRMAREMGLTARFEECLEGCIRYLLCRRHHSIAGSRNLHPQSGTAAAGILHARQEGFCWDEGVFFSGGFGDMTHWRSKAFTTAVVLEALAKYRLGYDLHAAPFHEGPRLRIAETKR